jgi:dinuclear metal center YbgI/SA1388 family protein
MHVSDLTNALHSLAPLQYASDWDNVGLLIGADDWPAASVLLTVDLTEPVLQEAISGGTQAVVAYHPPIFRPLAALTDRETSQRIALTAATAKIAVYSPHTALDAAPGGINDWLADALGTGDRRALEAHEAHSATERNKIVTFCPADAADTVRNGLASVGAGRIGDYEVCSFEIAGRGTFLGGAASSPAVGRAGRLERVDEVRLEMVCPDESLALAVATLRQLHPYEEPPVEVYRLQPRPLRSVGVGRRVVLDQKTDLSRLVERIKHVLGVKQLRVATAPGGPRKYRTIGLCPGAGGSLLDAAIAQGCELFITGEMRHHDVLSAQDRGCTVILAGHTNTERGYLKVLRKRLAAALPMTRIQVSRKDTVPWRVM